MSDGVAVDVNDALFWYNDYVAVMDLGMEMTEKLHNRSMRRVHSMYCYWEYACIFNRHGHREVFRTAIRSV